MLMGFIDRLFGRGSGRAQEVEQLQKQTRDLSAQLGVLRGRLAHTENENITLKKQVEASKQVRQAPRLIEKAEKRADRYEISQITTTELMGKPCITIEGFNVGYFAGVGACEGRDSGMVILGKKSPRHRQVFELMKGAAFTEMIRNHKYIKSAHTVLLARDLEGNYMPVALTPEEFARVERRNAELEDEIRQIRDSWSEVVEENKDLRNLVNSTVQLFVSSKQMGELTRRQVHDMLQKHVSVDSDIMVSLERATKQDKISRVRKEHVDELAEALGKDAQKVSKDDMEIALGVFQRLMDAIGDQKSVLKFLRKFTGQPEESAQEQTPQETPPRPGG
jgi:regulator of replication initiation timing